MDFNSAIKGRNIRKEFKGFTLDIPGLNIPEGFATALIGENGAGKTTLMNILCGIRLDYSGELNFFNGSSPVTREADADVKNRIGYTGTENYFLPSWTLGQLEELSGILFDNFDKDIYRKILKELAVATDDNSRKTRKISSLSDGTKAKLMLAGVLARDTDMLILDEPASPLDPLMREKLCGIIREYLLKKEHRTVLFSTHNISDMEDVTDYAIIMAHGAIVEEGFVEDLREKYIFVKGEPEDADKAREYMYTISRNKYGFEGICLAENIDRLAGLNLVKENASLFEISVAVMKKSSKVSFDAELIR